MERRQWRLNKCHGGEPGHNTAWMEFNSGEMVHNTDCIRANGRVVVHGTLLRRASPQGVGASLGCVSELRMLLLFGWCHGGGEEKEVTLDASVAHHAEHWGEVGVKKWGRYEEEGNGRRKK